MIENISILILGWLLGLLGPSIKDRIQDAREAKAVKTALFTELQEFQYRLVLIVFKIKSKYSVVDKEFFKWAKEILSKYQGVNESGSLLDTIEPLLKNFTDEQIKDFTRLVNEQKAEGSGLELKKHSLSLLDANIGLLSKFSSTLRANLLEIRTRIGFMNEAIDDARYYFRLSFQNDISTTNYDIADKNMINSYKAYGVQARIVVDFISKILHDED